MKSNQSSLKNLVLIACLASGVACTKKHNRQKPLLSSNGVDNQKNNTSMEEEKAGAPEQDTNTDEDSVLVRQSEQQMMETVQAQKSIDLEIDKLLSEIRKAPGLDQPKAELLTATGTIDASLNQKIITTRENLVCQPLVEQFSGLLKRELVQQDRTATGYMLRANRLLKAFVIQAKEQMQQKIDEEKNETIAKEMSERLANIKTAVDLVSAYFTDQVLPSCTAGEGQLVPVKESGASGRLLGEIQLRCEPGATSPINKIIGLNVREERTDLAVLPDPFNASTPKSLPGREVEPQSSQTAQWINLEFIAHGLNVDQQTSSTGWMVIRDDLADHLLNKIEVAKQQLYYPETLGAQSDKNSWRENLLYVGFQQQLTVDEVVSQAKDLLSLSASDIYFAPESLTEMVRLTDETTKKIEVVKNIFTGKDAAQTMQMSRLVPGACWKSLGAGKSATVGQNASSELVKRVLSISDQVKSDFEQKSETERTELTLSDAKAELNADQLDRLMFYAPDTLVVKEVRE